MAAEYSLVESYGDDDDDSDFQTAMGEPQEATSEEIFGSVGEVNGRSVTYDDSIQMSDSDGRGEVGTAATRIDDMGRVRVPNRTYDGYRLRGHWADDGLLYEYAISEPEVHEPMVSLVQLMRSADWTIDVDESASDEVQAYADWCRDWIKSLKRGWDRYILEAGLAMLIYGCMPHEVIWSDTDENGRRHPTKLAPREPNTIDQWILTDKGSELAGVHFRSMDDEYILTATGDDLLSHKLLVPSRLRIGANFAGISVLRPALHWIKCKRTLGQVLGVGAEIHSIPRTLIKEEALPEGSVDSESKKRIFNAISRARAIDSATLSLPPGIDVETQSAAGGMADILGYLEYVDRQIQRCLDRQGKSIPGSQTGSYALAEEEGESFRDQASLVAKDLVEPFNQLLQTMADRHLDDPSVYPQMTMSFDISRDSTAWLKDVKRMLGSEWKAYPAVRERVLEALELPGDALEEKDPLDAKDEAESVIEDAEIAPSSEDNTSDS